jgi:uncharacterized 2Fe-2S/4Fe-4S cluster protein (DUF4445 family)
MARIFHDGCSRELREGATLFDFADELAVPVATSCGRFGHCHECILELTRGMQALTPRAEEESFLRGNFRLACQARIHDAGCDVEFKLLQRRPKILGGLPAAKATEIDPVVTRRENKVYYNGEELDQYRGHLYGVAMDLGTTTVVIELVDLETGDIVASASLENPQRFGGSDVMNRISYDSGAQRGELHNAIVTALNRELRAMCEGLEFPRHVIYEVMVAGNSTMRDLFFGLDVQSIGQRPYKSLVEHEYLAGSRSTTVLTEKAHKLGIWSHPKARIVSAPLIASHVGADTAADLVAIDMESQHETVMLVDVGTNTEVVVAHAGRMLAASCPAGPAFEGGLIRYGMPGCDGAIESIRLRDGGFEYRTIGGGPPEGICGSGLVDLLAELRRHGRMTAKGVFQDKAYELTIVPEYGITFSREDASNLAQAKAANYCGQFIAMRKSGIGPRDISKLYLAGGFANYINIRNAIDIGFLASVPEDRIVKVGNAAIQGAREMLLSRRKRDAVEQLVKRIEHVELETTPDFFEVFVEACQFNPMPTGFVPAAAGR